jgi:SAM-dependent methyltransferase
MQRWEGRMSNPTLQAQVDAAKAYEALFVPALFGPWASRVAEAARIRAGDRVLDVACGTGVLARGVLSRTGPSGHVTGLDPSAGMLAVANEIAPAVTWQQGVAESLPFPDQSFDVVVSQFGLMFFADRQKALREILRVLTTDGRLTVVVWDALETIPVFAAEVELLERLAGRPAADALRAPFVLGDRHGLSTMFDDVGAANVVIETDEGTARFPSIRVLVEADLRGWLPVMGVFLAEEQIARVLQAAEADLARHVRSDDGHIEFNVRAHIVTATKPFA